MKNKIIQHLCINLKIRRPEFWTNKEEKDFQQRAFDVFVDTLMRFGTKQIALAMKEK